MGALCWNTRRLHGELWKKFGTALPSTELMFLMGTIHRFPDQWLIVSVFYPPKQQSSCLIWNNAGSANVYYVAAQYSGNRPRDASAMTMAWIRFIAK